MYKFEIVNRSFIISLLWIVVVPLLYHDGVWPMAQWHSYNILHHTTMSTRGFDTMNAHFEWKHSQYSLIMASQCFHYWLCPRGNQLHQVKSLPLPPFNPTSFQLSIIHVICPNGCNMHWCSLIVFKSTKFHI
jgi:hypothetical protein